ncbi:MAG TPA: polyphosphate:AMP phosphotransferase [Thermoanaerobaculia bacterium]|nr:polyphosphate:AMP phosphotransferase [Thermoanaerobaculia bacterium]
MFEDAELDHRLDPEEWQEQEARLRTALLDAQYDLSQQKRFATLVVIGGVEGAGKGETVNLLHEWMDPRHLLATAFGAPTDEERQRPPMWRFWRALPPRGRIGVFFGAWHSMPILDRAGGKIDDAGLERRIVAIRDFERMLTDEGVLLVKLWFHLSKKQQRRRFRELLASRRTAWRVTALDRALLENYDRLAEVSERVLRATSTGRAPWFVVPGADPAYRSAMVGKILLEALRERLDAGPEPPPPDRTPPLQPSLDGQTVLSALDLDRKVPKKRYEAELEKWQGRLARLTRKKAFRKRSMVAVFEGQDAAGKGGAIRRVTRALDARVYRCVPIAAPTEEELAQPYLWRFWRQLPRHGEVVVFDRSWYGRVLVERVEGYCSEEDWMRAYSEINDFEQQLVEHGVVVAKFWLAIDADEQLRRFREREKTPFKRFKITEDDWRNREKWPAYERAVHDMVERTSTEIAPWTLVEANDKRYARVKVLRTFCEAIEAAFER